VLTLEPVEKGILTLTFGAAKPAAAAPAQTAARFAPLALDASHRYTAYLTHQPGVTAGLVLRPWPVDLEQPLPVSQKPGEAFEISFTAAQAGTLRAEA